MTKQYPLRVFIGYSHDTVEHQERVLGFADRLRADAIDAEINQYNATPPEGWPLWMATGKRASFTNKAERQGCRNHSLKRIEYTIL